MMKGFRLKKYIIIMSICIGSMLSGQIDYYSEIEPILTGSCGGCHTTGNSSGFNLASYSSLMTTGNHGPVIIPFDSENSIIIQKLNSDPPFGNQMPPTGPLPFETIDFLAQWINEGALEYPEVDTLFPPALVINEFLAKNDSCCTDENGEYDDYIEIFNAGDSTIVLDGMFLTDDLSDPTKFMIPFSINDSANYYIAPGEFVLFWADDDSIQGINHLNFKLSGSGEQIGLFMHDGETAIDTLNYNVQFSDVSFGRFPDGSDTWIYANPSPGISNVNVLGIGVTILNPTSITLYPNFPNPFNPTTTFRFSVQSDQDVSLMIFDLNGRFVEMITQTHFSPGDYEFSWNASLNPNGIYFVRLIAGGQVKTQKVLYLK